MDPLIAAHSTLQSKSNLSKALSDVSTLIAQLQSARDSVAQSPELTQLHIAKLKPTVSASFEKIEEDLKEVNKGLNAYQKALTARFSKAGNLGGVPGMGDTGGGGGEAAEKSGGVGTGQSGMASGGGGDSEMDGEKEKYLNRAISMHLLREGEFEVAETFAQEARAMKAREERILDGGEGMHGVQVSNGVSTEDEAMGGNEDITPVFASQKVVDVVGSAMRTGLLVRFQQMYHILTSLRSNHDLEPAISWARQHSQELENRGSNLEFELARLKFLELYTSSQSDTLSGPLLALEYARQTFPPFSKRYAREISSLMGSLAFASQLEESPYNHLMDTPGSRSNYSAVAQTFTQEFTTLLNLPPTSPLYTAITAGAISLPTLTKLSHILRTTHSSWTSANELPVETPLPPSMRFHSVFVCPVSKEQATEANPPVMLPCGHVVAKESAEVLLASRKGGGGGPGGSGVGGRGKCAYCPQEFSRGEVRRVVI